MSKEFIVKIYPSYVGYGLSIHKNDVGDTLAHITSVIPGGPADLAGLNSNCKVIEIDGEPLKGLSDLAISRILETALTKPNATLSLSVIQESPQSLMSRRISSHTFAIKNTVNRSPLNYAKANRIYFTLVDHPHKKIDVHCSHIANIPCLKSPSRFNNRSPRHVSRKTAPAGTIHFIPSSPGQTCGLLQSWPNTVAPVTTRKWRPSPHVRRKSHQPSPARNSFPMIPGMQKSEPIYSFTRVGGVHLSKNIDQNYLGNGPASSSDGISTHNHLQSLQTNTVVRLCPDGTLVRGLPGIGSGMLRVHYFPPPYSGLSGNIKSTGQLSLSVSPLIDSSNRLSALEPPKRELADETKEEICITEQRIHLTPVIDSHFHGSRIISSSSQGDCSSVLLDSCMDLMTSRKSLDNENLDSSHHEETLRPKSEDQRRKFSPGRNPVGRAINPHVARNIRHLKRYMHMYSSSSPVGEKALTLALSTSSVNESSSTSPLTERRDQLVGVNQSSIVSVPVRKKNLTGTSDNLNISMSKSSSTVSLSRDTSNYVLNQSVGISETKRNEIPVESEWVEVLIREEDPIKRAGAGFCDFESFYIRIVGGNIQFRPKYSSTTTIGASTNSRSSPEHYQFVSIPVKGTHVQWIDSESCSRTKLLFNGPSSNSGNMSHFSSNTDSTTMDNQPSVCQLFRGGAVNKNATTKLEFFDHSGIKTVSEGPDDRRFKILLDFKCLRLRFNSEYLAELALKPFVFLTPKNGKRHHFGANFFGNFRSNMGSCGSSTCIHSSTKHNTEHRTVPQVLPVSGISSATRSSSLGVAGPPGPMPLYVAVGTLGASFGLMSLQKLNAITLTSSGVPSYPLQEVSTSPKSKKLVKSHVAISPTHDAKNRIKKALTKIKKAAIGSNTPQSILGPISSPQPLLIQSTLGGISPNSSSEGDKHTDEVLKESYASSHQLNSCIIQAEGNSSISSKNQLKLFEESVEGIGPLIRKASPTRLSLTHLKKLSVFHSAEGPSSEDGTSTSSSRKTTFISSQSDAQTTKVNSKASTIHEHAPLQQRLSSSFSNTSDFNSSGDKTNSKLQLFQITNASGADLESGVISTVPVLVSGSMPLHKCPRSTVSPFVPFVVELCVTLTERFGLNCVGIYRMSGAKIAQDFISMELTKSINEINVNSEKWNDINAVSCVLKTFLRNLPDSLFPRQMYPEFMAACKIEDHERRLLSIQRLLGIMECYPEHSEFRVHRATLRYLITHLGRVAARQSINKMTPYNLALVFAPNLLQPNIETPEILMLDSKYKIWLVETLIKYHEWIFSPDLGLESGCTVPPDSTEDIPSASNTEEQSMQPATALEETAGRQEGDVRPFVADLLQAALNLPPPLDDLESAEEPGPDTDRPADLEAARLLRQQQQSLFSYLHLPIDDYGLEFPQGSREVNIDVACLEKINHIDQNQNLPESQRILENTSNFEVPKFSMKQSVKDRSNITSKFRKFNSKSSSNLAILAPVYLDSRTRMRHRFSQPRKPIFGVVVMQKSSSLCTLAMESARSTSYDVINQASTGDTLTLKNIDCCDGFFEKSTKELRRCFSTCDELRILFSDNISCSVTQSPISSKQLSPYITRGHSWVTTEDNEHFISNTPIHNLDQTCSKTVYRKTYKNFTNRHQPNVMKFASNYKEHSTDNSSNTSPFHRQSLHRQPLYQPRNRCTSLCMLFEPTSFA